MPLRVGAYNPYEQKKHGEYELTPTGIVSHPADEDGERTLRHVQDHDRHPQHTDESFLYSLPLRFPNHYRLLDEDFERGGPWVEGDPVPRLKAAVWFDGEFLGDLRLTPHGVEPDPAPNAADAEWDNGRMLAALVEQVKRPHWSAEYFLRGLPDHCVNPSGYQVRLEEGPSDEQYLRGGTPDRYEWTQQDEEKHARDHGKFASQPGGGASALPGAVPTHPPSPTATPPLPASSAGGKPAPGLLERTGQAFSQVEHLVEQTVRNNLQRLPDPVRQQVEAAWQVCVLPYAQAWQMVQSVAGGDNSETMQRAAALAMAVDVAWAKTPAVLNVLSHVSRSLFGGPGWEEIPEALSLLPVGSVAFLAFAATQKPLETLRAAHRLVFNADAAVRQMTTFEKQDDVRAIMAWANEKPGPWAHALLAAALDQRGGELRQALRVADLVLQKHRDFPGGAV